MVSATSCAILLAALAVDGLVGDPPWLYRRIPHPVAAFGALAEALERALYGGATRRARVLRGALLVGLATAAAAAAGLALDAGLRALGPFWAAAGETLALAVLLALRGLHDAVRAVGRGLRGDLDAARHALRHLVGRDPETLDRPAIARAAIESLAENFSDGVVAPAFWFLLLGLPGLFAYKAINTLDSMIGYRNARYRDFGWAAARLDDLANWAPARLCAGLFLLAAAFAPGADPAAAWRALRRDARRHRSPNAGWPEAAVGGALGLAFGGPRRYGGAWLDDVWIGGKRAAATADDIDRALALYRRAAAVMAVGLAAGAGLALLSPHG